LISRKFLPLLWAAVVCILVAHNGYLWLMKRMVPDTDILALLPVQQRDPALQQAFSRMVDAAQQRLIVLIGAPEWTDATRAADAFRSVLVLQPAVVQLSEGTLGRSESEWLAPFQAHRLILLTSYQEAMLRSESSQVWVDSALETLYSPFAGPKLGAWRDDPFGLFGAWLQERARETPVRPRDGRLFVGGAGRQYVVLPMTLGFPAFSLSGQQTLLALLDQAQQAAAATVPQIEIIRAGVVLHAATEGARARRELAIIGIGSSIGVIGLVWLAFRSVKPIVWVMLSVFVGCLGASSICWLLFERLHLLTLVFGASLIGVAEDYGIYFVCRRYAADPTLDSWRLLRRLLPPLILTLVTTVIGYVGLAVTPFPGLQQMAVFSISGLCIAWLTVVFWFPALVRSDKLSNVALTDRYAATAARWPLVRPNRTTFLAILAFSAFAVTGWSRLNVLDDIRALQKPPTKLLDDQVAVGKLLDVPAPTQFYLVRGSTAEAVLQREEMLKQRLDPMVQTRLISGYQALSNWVPSLRTQETRKNLIDRKLLGQRSALADLAARIGEHDEWVATMRRHMLASAAPLLPGDFLANPASEPWRHLWLGRIGGGYASIVALRGVNKASLPMLQNVVVGLGDVQWVDKVEEISSVLAGYRTYMSWVTVIAFVAVYALLHLRYGSASWRVLAPTAVASIGIVALLGLTGHHLQLFHVLGLMLLLGIGVDYGIFFHEQPTNGDSSAWLAVGLSALSTLLSFGLLGLSQMPAMGAFGITMAIGIATVWLVVPCFAPARAKGPLNQRFAR
jgi:predicted exporter